jgi:hypothetical protein
LIFVLAPVGHECAEDVAVVLVEDDQTFHDFQRGEFS